MGSFKYPLGLNLKHMFLSLIVCFLLFCFFEYMQLLRSDLMLYFLLGQIAIYFMVLLIILLCLLSAILSLLTIKRVSELAAVTRTVEYIRGKGFQNILSLHLDHRPGRKYLRQNVSHNEKASFIYTQFAFLIQEVKQGIYRQEGIYKNLHIIKATSPLITPSRMKVLGVDVKEVTSLYDKWMIKISLYAFRMKSREKNKIYSFELSVEEFKQLDEERIFDYVRRINKKWLREEENE